MLFSDSDNEDTPRSVGSSKKERFFWQYNVQSKGPKGTRLVIKTQAEDPHVLNEVTDPVFSPNCSVRGIKVIKVRLYPLFILFLTSNLIIFEISLASPEKFITFCRLRLNCYYFWHLELPKRNFSNMQSFSCKNPFLFILNDVVVCLFFSVPMCMYQGSNVILVFN